jgi:hypothetical protein
MRAPTARACRGRVERVHAAAVLLPLPHAGAARPRRARARPQPAPPARRARSSCRPRFRSCATIAPCWQRRRALGLPVGAAVCTEASRWVLAVCIKASLLQWGLLCAVRPRRGRCWLSVEAGLAAPPRACTPHQQRARACARRPLLPLTGVRAFVRGHRLLYCLWPRLVQNM